MATGFYAAYTAVSVLLFFVALITLVWTVEAWKTPEELEQTAFLPPDAPRLSFSLIVPARHEEAVLGRTLDNLATVDHPRVEILVVVGHDDPATQTVAHAAAGRHPGTVRVLLDRHPDKHKPKALNTPLGQCRGDVVGVFDAEDEVAPALLRHVDTLFRARGGDIVQGGVQLMNFASSWWSLRNVLEYYLWFASRLHGHARKQFVPLGGNTVFFRRDLLERAGGWDEACLAEDCEIGIRLGRRAPGPQSPTRRRLPLGRRPR